MERTLIVGLGNPGPRYENTRHNIGFLAVDEIASQHRVQLTTKKFNGVYGQGSGPDSTPLTLLKPHTFMNLSGQSVQPCAHFFKIPIQRIIVIHDELDLPFGTIKLKEGGGHAGHNGLKSLINRLGSRDFIRIRVGIGRPQKQAVSDYVLSSFSQDENPWLSDVCRQVAFDLDLIFNVGLKKATT
jgi:PTH1 family peptidyl-tRNA hydrolase